MNEWYFRGIIVLDYYGNHKVFVIINFIDNEGQEAHYISLKNNYI